MIRGKTIQIVILLLLLAAAGLQADIGERRGAMLRSALLPGLGQIHLGHDTRGAIFIGVEAVTWAGFGLSYLEGVFERDDYTMLALEEAGISMSDRSSQFMDDVSDFGSSAEFNDYIHRLARYYFPDDPDAQREYYETHSRYGADGWTWSSEDAMRSFGDHLRDSRQWFRRSLYIAAFALVNRAVSVIDAALLDPAAPGIYTDLSFPETGDFSSVRFALGTRF